MRIDKNDTFYWNQKKTGHISRTDNNERWLGDVHTQKL